jgi:hypothetical protein
VCQQRPGNSGHETANEEGSQLVSKKVDAHYFGREVNVERPEESIPFRAVEILKDISKVSRMQPATSV